MLDPQHPFHEELSFGPVELAVGDLAGTSSFYSEILGLVRIPDTSGGVRLGAAGRPLIVLRENSDATPAPERSAGLFHVALLVPERADLSAVLRRLVGSGIPVGSADHLASEAVYISDPEGNGIEIYRDRPASEWPRQPDGRPRIATLPLDPELLEVASSEAGLPAGTIIGHVHLKVNDLETAVGFYRDAVGLGVMAALPGAAFLGAGGYHHHIGLNTWQSAGGDAPPAGARGLAGLRLHRAGAVPRHLTDPTGTPLEIAA